MRFNFFLLFVVLLISYVSAGVTGDVRLNRKHNREIFMKDFESVKRRLGSLNKKYNSNQNGMKLVDLNVDCLYLILEQLDLPDLVNMAQVNAEFYNLATNVFVRKFSRHIRFERFENIPKKFGEKLLDYTDKLAQHILGFPLADRKPAWIEGNETLKIYDYTLGLSTLKYFGGVIRRLEVESLSLSREKVALEVARETLYAYLTKYCASSLLQLDIGTVENTWLAALKGPFTRLEEFTIDVGYLFSDVPIKTMSVAQMFPNLRRLIIENVFSMESPIIFDGFLPLLEYLKVEKSHRSQINPIDNFVKQNSHIRSIELTGFPNDYIQTIHEFLPNLENLTLDSGSSNGIIEIGHPIHFEHLKVLHLVSSRFDSLINISFSHLEELSMYYTNNEVNQWIQFFGMNHTFTRFILHDSGYPGIESKIQSIIDALPLSVVDISITSDLVQVPETIVKILESRDNLMKFQFANRRQLVDMDRVFRERCENHWEITKLDHSWVFIRKN